MKSSKVFIVHGQKEHVEEPKDVLKKELRIIVDIFFKLQDHYLHDDPDVIRELELFNGYLKEFSDKYPALDVLIDEEDLTSDDLKILLVGFSVDELRMLAKSNQANLIFKHSKKHDGLQVLVNYDALNNQYNPALDLLCKLAAKDAMDKKIRMPAPLAHLSSTIRDTGLPAGYKMVNRSR